MGRIDASVTGGGSVDVDGLAAVVPPAVAAHDVGQLGGAAARAGAAGRSLDGPGRGATAAALRLGGLLLGDGHGSRAFWWCGEGVVVRTGDRSGSGPCRSNSDAGSVLEGEVVEGGPAGIAGSLLVVGHPGREVVGRRPPAAFGASRRQWQREQHGVADERLEVDLLTHEG